MSIHHCQRPAGKMLDRTPRAHNRYYHRTIFFCSLTTDHNSFDFKFSNESGAQPAKYFLMHSTVVTLFIKRSTYTVQSDVGKRAGGGSDPPSEREQRPI